MAQRLKSLNDVIVVIVGASSGFGRGAALELAAQGAKVVVAARRKAQLNELVDEIQAQGGVALAVPVDVSEASQIGNLAEAAVSRFGRIDVWVNNVGVGAIGYFWDIPIED